MIFRQLFSLVLSLAVSTMIVAAALAQDHQKRRERQQTQQTCPPAGSVPALAPRLQPQWPPAGGKGLIINQELPPIINTDQPPIINPEPPSIINPEPSPIINPDPPPIINSGGYN